MSRTWMLSRARMRGDETLDAAVRGVEALSKLALVEQGVLASAQVPSLQNEIGEARTFLGEIRNIISLVTEGATKSLRLDPSLVLLLEHIERRRLGQWAGLMDQIDQVFAGLDRSPPDGPALTAGIKVFTEIAEAARAASSDAESQLGAGD